MRLRLLMTAFAYPFTENKYHEANGIVLSFLSAKGAETLSGVPAKVFRFAAAAIAICGIGAALRLDIGP